MAKRHKSRSTALARRPSVKPIVIRTTKVVKAKHRRSGHRGGRGLTGIFSKDKLMTLGAGFAVGALEKMAFVQSLPSLPYIGKTGTLAIGAYLMSDGGRNKIAVDIATSAAAICGYMLGSTGTIVGDGANPYGDGWDAQGYVAGW